MRVLGREERCARDADLPIGRRRPARPGQLRGRGATAALGLALHYLIALSISLVYYLAARRWQVLWRRAIRCGAGYGLLVYGIMNYLVVPLSAAGPGSKDPVWVALTIAAHVLLIGIPIALLTRPGTARNQETRSAAFP
ncbi:MAG TPA: hypothetical protein VIT87_02620 [Gemmatimonadales bacterium]